MCGIICVGSKAKHEGYGVGNIIKYICDRISENLPKRGKLILWVVFFFFMAEMDRHQLALVYDAVVSSGEL